MKKIKLIYLVIFLIIGISGMVFLQNCSMDNENAPSNEININKNTDIGKDVLISSTRNLIINSISQNSNCVFSLLGHLYIPPVTSQDITIAAYNFTTLSYDTIGSGIVYNSSNGRLPHFAFATTPLNQNWTIDILSGNFSMIFSSTLLSENNYYSICGNTHIKIRITLNSDVSEYEYDIIQQNCISSAVNITEIIQNNSCDFSILGKIIILRNLNYQVKVDVYNYSTSSFTTIGNGNVSNYSNIKLNNFSFTSIPSGQSWSIDRYSGGFTIQFPSSLINSNNYGGTCPNKIMKFRVTVGDDVCEYEYIVNPFELISYEIDPTPSGFLKLHIRANECVFAGYFKIYFNNTEYVTPWYAPVIVDWINTNEVVLTLRYKGDPIVQGLNNVRIENVNDYFSCLPSTTGDINLDCCFFIKGLTASLLNEEVSSPVTLTINGEFNNPCDMNLLSGNFSFSYDSSSIFIPIPASLVTISGNTWACDLPLGICTIGYHSINIQYVPANYPIECTNSVFTGDIKFLVVP